MINIIISILSLLSCVVIAEIICRKQNYNFAARNASRLGGIDGLRGYLALGVFINHFTITYEWQIKGTWSQPPEHYFTTFGQTGVSIFFMITGYLFIYKLLSNPNKINWKVLYLSRFFRIVPLYLFAVLLILATVAYQTSFTAQESPWELFKNISHWGLFLEKEINQFADTKYIVAAVFWTLHYEWLFYLLLPFIAFILLQKSKVMLIVSIIIILYIAVEPVQFNIFEKYYFKTFLFILFLIGGFTAAIRAKNFKLVSKYADHYLVTIAIITSILIALFAFEKSYNVLPVLLITLFFIPVALGNTLFGLLKWESSIFLGEISYSIYLMHGFILYLTFSVLFPNFITLENRDTFLLSMPILALLTVLMSWITYSFIEKPMMAMGKKIGKKYLVKTSNAKVEQKQQPYIRPTRQL